MIFHEKVAYDYFQKLFASKHKLVDSFHRLNHYELKKIRKIENRANLFAGLFGALGVILLYLPIHLKPDLFPFVNVNMPWIGLIAFPWAYTLYMIFLAMAEILALTWLNLVIVHAICRVCGFPTTQDGDYEVHIQTLFEVSLDKRNKDSLKLGINPLAGVSGYTVLFFSTLFILKATLSNFLIKFLLKRMFSRVAMVGYAIYVDYISIIIFAAWNIYATRIIVNEAKTRIMAPNLIAQLVIRLHHEFKEEPLFKEMLLDVLQFIAVAKRNFHHNHYLLAERIVAQFALIRHGEIKIDQNILLTKINNLPPHVKQGIAKLFVLGILIDGKVSQRELYLLAILRKQGVLQLSNKQLRIWEKDFTVGRGLDELFQKGVPL